MDKLSDVDLADVLNNISTYLNTAMTLACDPKGGVEVSEVIVNYCADYAKRTAKRVEQSLGGGAMKQLDSSGMVLEANGEIDSVISALSAAYEMLNHKDNVAHEVGILHISINQLEATLKKLNTVGMNI